MTLIINLSPVNKLGRLTLSVEGYKLSVCGEVFDFTSLLAGYELALADIKSPLFGDRAVMHSDGTLEVCLILPYENPNASPNVTFPEQIVVTENGPVSIPQDESARPSPEEETLP